MHVKTLSNFADMPAPRTGTSQSGPTEQLAPGTRRLQVRRSGIHGRGVYAVVNLNAGERLMEYTGEIISWEEALDRHPHDPANPQHTFYFHIDGGQVIDAKFGGNSSRWINHSCAPNCVARQVGSRVFIDALRDIPAGEELFYDYGLTIDERLTPALKAEYPCWCGAADCTGTLLKPKRRAVRKARRGTPNDTTMAS